MAILMERSNQFAEMIDKHKLLMVTGKGGIGKTTVSTLIALLANTLGKRVLIVESGVTSQIPALFGQQVELSNGPSKLMTIAPGIDTINLGIMDNFREYMTSYLKQKRLFDTVFSHKVIQTFISTIPGFSEVMLLGRLFYLSELSDRAYDLVIFDAFASGHFQSFVTTPDAVIQSGVGGPIVKELRKVREFLADDAKVGVLFVAIPEELIISEVIDFVPRLKKRSPAKVKGIVFNRLIDDQCDSPFYEQKIIQQKKALDDFAQHSASAESEYHDLSRLTIREGGFIEEPFTANSHLPLTVRH
jgi:arsenite/tail-anchored protein-transporting ATPase